MVSFPYFQLGWPELEPNGEIACDGSPPTLLLAVPARISAGWGSEVNGLP